MQDHARPPDRRGPLHYERTWPNRRGITGPFTGLLEFLAGPARLAHQTVGLGNVFKAGAALLLIAVLTFGPGSAPVSSTPGPSAAPALTAAATTPDPDNLVFLILGVDSMQDRGRSDTVLVVHLMLKDRKVRILSIPRDTYAHIERPGGGTIQDKLNHSYRFGGAELTKKTVERNLGIKIDYYGVVDYDLFRKAIDLIGCVELDVERRFYYIDRAGGLKVDLYPGKQQLCGDKALQYVRFRHDAMGDEGRIVRQQKFLGAALAKLKDPKVVTFLGFKLPSLLEFVTTDVPSQVAMGLLWKVKDLTARDLQMASVPGEGRLMDTPVHRNKLWFWVQDDARLERLKKEWFHEPNATQDTVKAILKGKERPVAGLTDRPSSASPSPAASPSAPGGEVAPVLRSPFQPPRTNGKKKPASPASSKAAASPRAALSPKATASPKPSPSPKASSKPDAKSGKGKSPKTKPSPSPPPAPVPGPSPAKQGRAAPEEETEEADAGEETADDNEMAKADDAPQDPVGAVIRDAEQSEN